MLYEYELNENRWLQSTQRSDWRCHRGQCKYLPGDEAISVLLWYYWWCDGRCYRDVQMLRRWWSGAWSVSRSRVSRNLKCPGRHSTSRLRAPVITAWWGGPIYTSMFRSIRRPLLVPPPYWKPLLALSHLYKNLMTLMLIGNLDNLSNCTSINAYLWGQESQFQASARILIVFIRPFSISDLIKVSIWCSIVLHQNCQTLLTVVFTI